MSLEHNFMQAYVITKRSSNFNYNLRVDVQIPELNIKLVIFFLVLSTMIIIMSMIII